MAEEDRQEESLEESADDVQNLEESEASAADDIQRLEEGAEEDQSLEEWLEEERIRLERGFTYEPKPLSGPAEPQAVDDILAGVGLGAGVAAGIAAPHPNPVMFEGVRPGPIVGALRSKIPDDDTQVLVEQSGNSVVVTVLQSPEGTYKFLPALTVTLIEKEETLTVTVSDLSGGSVRETLGSIGGTLIDQGRRAVSRPRRRGPGAILDVASNMKDGIEDLVEDIQDLSLPRRVWKVIDSVGGAAEEAYQDERRAKRAEEWKREEAEQAWTHCAWCGRAYGTKEGEVTQCPTCGAPRGAKPNWLA